VTVLLTGGRVDELRVTADVELWGHLDPASGLVTLRERPRPGTEDLLNLATVHALRCGGRVHVFDGEGMPGKAAIAPIFRYRPSRWQAERPPVSRGIAPA
jgi:hypothetical protein